MKTLTVKHVSTRTGVSVRALQYWDELGLLSPGRSEAGHRRYDAQALLRLQQILIRRELGFSLEEIPRSLDDPKFDLEKALESQRKSLQRRAQDTARLLASVDEAIATLKNKRPVFEAKLFDGFDPAVYEAEADDRWGSDPKFAESKRRTAKYSASDWARFKAEQDAVYVALADALKAGWKPTTPRVKALAEKHRRLIDRWFYACDREHHARLADLYENDPRFAANIDAYAQGLTSFLCAAIRH
ncbi:MAG: MerR family transcriptional regulator [Archangium sp.]